MFCHEIPARATLNSAPKGVKSMCEKGQEITLQNGLFQAVTTVWKLPHRSPDITLKYGNSHTMTSPAFRTGLLHPPRGDKADTNSGLAASETIKGDSAHEAITRNAVNKRWRRMMGVPNYVGPPCIAGGSGEGPAGSWSYFMAQKESLSCIHFWTHCSVQIMHVPCASRKKKRFLSRFLFRRKKNFDFACDSRISTGVAHAHLLTYLTLRSCDSQVVSLSSQPKKPWQNF